MSHLNFVTLGNQEVLVTVEFENAECFIYQLLIINVSQCVHSNFSFFLELIFAKNKGKNFLKYCIFLTMFIFFICC